MINEQRTLQELHIDITTLRNNSSKKVWFKCNHCGAEKLKKFCDCINGTGLCLQCSIAKNLNNLIQVSKQQQVKGKCLDCQTPIHANRKRCNTCHKRFMSNRMSGSNNPAYTGKHICECGHKKSFGAKYCRSCSLKHGMKSGPNNGRYIKTNREQHFINRKYLQNIRTREKIKANPLLMLRYQIHHTIKESLYKYKYTKQSKTQDLLQCSYQEFMEHLGPKPEGKVHLDHVCPCAQAQNEEELIKLQHWSNFRWLPAEENESKSDKWTPEGEELCKKLLNREWITILS